MTKFLEPTRDVARLIRGELVELEPYKPVEPLEALSQRAGVSPERLIKLDANENPYGCSPRVRRALGNYHSYHIYPDPWHRELCRALEAYVGVSAEHIVVGSGSDELVDLILRLFVGPGDSLIDCQPTFPVFSLRARICGGTVVDVPRDAAYAIDVAAVKKAITECTKLIFVASPNNPTGNMTPLEDILGLIDSGIVVVVDEAYYEFGGVTVAPLVAKYDNLFVLRSFSKWAGLAGLRTGYGIFPPGVAELLYKIKLPYNVSLASQIAVMESLADIEYLKGVVRLIIAERERLSARLKEQGRLQPLPSEANFILCFAGDGEAAKIYHGLAKKGIFVRYFDTHLLKNAVRITVGKPEHTDALIEALTQLGGKDDG